MTRPKEEVIQETARPETKTIAERFRKKLSDSVNSAWQSDEGKQMKDVLRKAVYMLGIPHEYELIMRETGAKQRMEDVARRKGLGDVIKAVWGKL